MIRIAVGSVIVIVIVLNFTGIIGDGFLFGLGVGWLLCVAFGENAEPSVRSIDE